MHELGLLKDVVIVVAVAIPVVVVAQRLHIPTIVGFLVTGVAIGPHALRFVADGEQVAGIAELGAILLLFTIGLELSLSRIIRLGRPVLQGGSLQVLGTAAVVGLLATLFGLPLRQAAFVGALAALSSTAIVLKIYTDRGELDTPHGRVVMATLLFQDLAVVPLMLVTPWLAGLSAGAGAALRQVASSLLVVAAIVVGGRLVIPWLLERIIGLRHREIFTLVIVFCGLGAAYVTASFGLSLALGAFLAGLVISESEYGLQALSDVLPFRDTFSGLFFISIGMLLDIGVVVTHWPVVLGLAAGIPVLKTIVATLAARSLRRSLEVSILAGLALAQVGEFSFVLAVVGVPLGLLDGDAYQLFLSTSVLTMLMAPFLIAGSTPIATAICRMTRQPALELAPHEERGIAGLQDHVIVVGYGLNGRNLARVLKASAIPYIVLEQNGQVIRRARMEREPILLGDGTRPEVLERVGVARARVVVFAISAPADERRGVAGARSSAPNVRIIVRTRYTAAVEELRRLGADEVIPEEFETSIEIFSRVLRLYGVPSNVIAREVEAVRGEQYEMLRGLSLPDLRLDALRHLGVHGALDTVEVEPGARAVGQNPVSMSLRRKTGAIVIAAVRDGVAIYTPDPDFRFQAGDTVVLVGNRDALDRAVLEFRTAS
jgi:CPA2 family monovalent cation:H+ antiporter-2